MYSAFLLVPWLPFYDAIFTATICIFIIVFYAAIYEGFFNCCFIIGLFYVLGTLFNAVGCLYNFEFYFFLLYCTYTVIIILYNIKNKYYEYIACKHTSKSWFRTTGLLLLCICPVTSRSRTEAVMTVCLVGHQAKPLFVPTMVCRASSSDSGLPADCQFKYTEQASLTMVWPAFWTGPDHS